MQPTQPVCGMTTEPLPPRAPGEDWSARNFTALQPPSTLILSTREGDFGRMSDECGANVAEGHRCCQGGNRQERGINSSSWETIGGNISGRVAAAPVRDL
jgi:hypothetical protein